MVDDSSADRDPVEELAEEFLERRRRGETPSLKEYTDRYPDLADEIRDVFPALVMMEEVDPASADLSKSESGAHGELDSHRIEQLGDYRILREVGRGGMGIVYEAEQLSLGRRVALKVLPQQMLLDKKHKRRFEREAKAAAKLHHTNIVPVFGVGEQDGLHYYVMQFIQGLGLDEVIGELQRMREASQAGRASSHGELRVSRRGGDVSAARVARSLMTGEFERTILTDAEAAPEEGPARLGSTVGYDPQGGKAGVTGSPTRLEVQQSGAGGKDLALESSGLKDTSSGRRSDSFTLFGSFSLPGRSDASGSTSASRARRRQTFWTSVATIGQQVASALQYAHEQGITHRDIKPSNLLLDMRGTVWVTDFGLAKATDQQDITHTGDILGTLRYMPPEAFEGKSDPRSDLYSLGLTLYELLAQRPAFDEKDRHKLVKLVTTSEPQRIEKLNPDVPRDLATIVHKAIDRDPAHRYPSARELTDDLQRFLDDEPIKARRISIAERLARWSRRNRGLAASLSVISALVVVIAIGSTFAAGHFRRAAHENAKLANDNRQLADEQTGLAQRMRLLADEKTRLAADKEAERQSAQVARRNEQNLRELAQRQTYAADMKAAQAALQQNHSDQAVRILNQYWPQPGEPDLRGIEWRVLWQAARGDEIYTWRHPAMVPGAHFSPNGEFVATACFDRNLRVWNVATGALVTQFNRDISDETVRISFCFAPDGSTLATLAREGLVLLDCQTWQVRQVVELSDAELDRNRSSSSSLMYSPDGAWLVARIGRGVMRIWNTMTWESFSLPASTDGRIAFSPDSKSIVACRADGAIKAWDLATRQQSDTYLDPATRPDGNNESWFLTAFSPQGDLLVSASGMGNVALWDVHSGKAVWLEQAHRSRVYGLAFSHDGTRFASGGFDQLIHIWDTATREKLMTLSGHLNEIWSLEFSPDDRYLLTSSKDGTVKLWDAQTPPQPDYWMLEEGERPIGFTPDGKGLIALLGDGVTTRQKLRHWSGPDVVKTLTCPRPFMLLLTVFSPESQCLYALNRNQVEVLDASTLELKRSFRIPDRCSALYHVSPDQHWLTGRGATFRELYVWDAISGETVAQFGGFQGNTNGPDVAVFSPDSRTLAFATNKWEVKLWDTAQQQVVRTLGPHPWRVNAISFSHDSRYIASSSWEGDIRIHEVATGRETATLYGHGSGVHTHTFSPDGATLISGGDDSSVRFWNLATGREMLAFEQANSQFLSPTGQLLFWRDFSQNLRVRVQVIPTTAEIEAAHRAATTTDAQTSAGAPGSQ